MNMNVAIKIIRKIEASRSELNDFEKSFITSINLKAKSHKFLSDKQAAFLCRIAEKLNIDTTKISPKTEKVAKENRGWHQTKEVGNRNFRRKCR